MSIVVAAYASIRSLLQVLDNPACSRLSPNTTCIQTLHEKVTLLEEFLENYSVPNDQEDIEDLARQIAEVANEAEAIIDFHVVDLLVHDQVHRGSKCDETCIGSLTFYQDISKVIEKFDSINEMFKEREGIEKKLSRIFLPISPLPSMGGKNSTTAVGLDDHVVRIMDQLTGNQTDLQIIPIVGMGGIGKTTLARNIFDNKLVVEHFDVRIWFTISQEYSVRETLLRVLHDVGVRNTSDLKSKTLAALQHRLHQILSGRRYLIVMDDLWSIKAWDDFKFFFADNGQKSRIMVTTRILDVANSLGSREPYKMNLLDDHQSWNLLCKSIFRQESCSIDLVGIGRRIAEGCNGLPLALVAIGGLLAKSDMTQEYWEFVARNVNSFVNSDNDDHCLKVLHLSYNHLPIHLKPCFLYMRVFPEDCEVQVSDLIKLWIAEGFLKPIKGREWEEVAKEYLKDLIDRNLILIRKWSHTRKVKTCGIHDLFRDLCMRESHNKLFSGIPKVQQFVELDDISANKCVLCGEQVPQKEMILIHKLHSNSGSTSSAIVLACEGCNIMYSNLSSRLRMVTAVQVRFIDPGLYVELLQTTKLRYLSLRYSTYGRAVIDHSLHLLWNLQTLNIGLSCYARKVLPPEIWEMTQLRHIYLGIGFRLPDPVEVVVTDEFEKRRNVTILENLQTLVRIVDFRCTEVLLKRMRNLKKLGLDFYEDASNWSICDKLVNLDKLESLSLYFSRRSSLEGITFPNSLKKLKLDGCQIPWEKMSMLGSLPNLEVLKLKFDAFVGTEWNPVEGEFLTLKFLSIQLHKLERWRAECIHFPVLETLQLLGMESLEAIPYGIGDIATLRSIDVQYSSDSVNESAMGIVEEQHSFGNEDLQLYVNHQRYQIYTDS